MLSRIALDLQHMFEMMFLCVDPGLKSLPSVIDDRINDGLPEVCPYLNQTLFQLIDVVYALLIHPVLKTAPNFVTSRLGLGPDC